MKQRLTTLKNKPLSAVALLGWAFTLSFLLESLNRHSMFSALAFMATKPLVFIYNLSIVLLSLSIALLFKKKMFYMGLITFVWGVLGTVNFVIRFFRKTPLTADDFRMITHLHTVLSFYLKPYQFFLLIALSIGALMVVLYSWLKSAKHRRQLKQGLIVSMASALTLLGLPTVSLSIQAFKETDGNLGKTYNEFGFAYSFMGSVINKGISKPEVYDQETIEQYLSYLYNHQNKPVEANIVFVQLESFFDVHRLDGLSFSEDPIPNYRNLLTSYSSGRLKVPSLGGGTANTEFEVISGMNLEYFGIGEYPYKTILSSNTTESLPYVLRELGYHSTAIHNNNANFYSRHHVFANLGFDVFDSLETMQNVSFNPIGWAKDDVLIDRIDLALKQSDQKDFVYTIAVSSHGDYPSDVSDEYKTIWAEGELGSVNPDSMAYFLTLLKGVDDVIGELTAYVKSLDEPTVMIFFGDHLPGLDFPSLDEEEEYYTEYVIVDNLGLPKVDKNVTTYQLGAHVLSKLNVSGGLLHKVHSQQSTMPYYQDLLHLFQYDMLYGDGYLYNHIPQYQPTELNFGIEPMEISEVLLSGEYLLVKGNHFTTYHRVVIDGKHVETMLLNRNLLAVKCEEVSKWMNVAVALISENNETIYVSPSKIVSNGLAR